MRVAGPGSAPVAGTRWRALAVLGLLCAPVACQFDRAGLAPGDGPAPADDAAPPPDAATPPADGPTGVDGHVAPDAAPTCVPASCPLGCNATLDRCNRLDPANFDVQGFYDDLTAGLASPDLEDIRVHTDTGEIESDTTTYRPAGSPGQTVNGIYFQVVVQPGGVPLAVFGVTGLDVPEDVNLVIQGPNPAALFVRGDATVSGDIDAWAWYDRPGPGGSAGGARDGADGHACYTGAFGWGGGQGGSSSWQVEAGGGGGGLRAVGGAGADGVLTGTRCDGGAGGVPAVAYPQPTPLTGGCGGGAGGGPDDAGDEPNNGGSGGGGGGGVQLAVEGQLTITATGVIDVGGGQGQGGQHGAGGGGGGAGGAILLEAASITMSGLLAANGGGGGAGAPGLDGNGEDGEPAHQSLEPAAGGTGTSYGGSGGAGGAAAIDDGANGIEDANGGGGGGGVGVVAIACPGLLDLVAGLVSPSDYQTSTVVSTW